MKIDQQGCSDEFMDQSSSDIVAPFSEISIQNENDEQIESLDRVYGSEIIQGYFTVVASCAYDGCINFLKLMSLRKKILDE